jgi:hypothetical protein
MSVAIQFSLTAVGQLAAWNAKNTGITLDLTHVQLGSGNRVPDGTEVALLQAKETATIAGGSRITPTQVRMSALYSSNLGYEIREIGLWSGKPGDAGSVLVWYWSQAAGLLAVKAPGVDFVFSHDMVFDGAVPAGVLNIQADAAQAPLLAMLAAHEAKADPHPQYASRAGIQLQSYTAFATAGAAPALTLLANPAPAKLEAGLRLRAKFMVNDTGADTLDVNGFGAKAIKQYDGGGLKVPARYFAGQLSDIEYDGADWVLLDPLPSFDLSANYDFVVGVQTGVTANALYTPAVIKPRGVYLITPYSNAWSYANAGGSHFITAFCEVISGAANGSSTNLTQDGAPWYDRSPFVVRITSPLATVRFGIKNNGSTPPGLGTVTVTAGVQAVNFYGRRIG